MSYIKIINSQGEQVVIGKQAPYFLESLEGAGEVQVLLEAQKAPTQDGMTYMDNTLDNRFITIEGMIVAKKEPRAVMENRRQLQRVLNPKLGEVRILYEGKEITGIAETTPDFPGGQGNKGLYYQKFLLYLVCHQPFWLDPAYQGRELSYLMGGIRFGLKLPTSFSHRGFRRKAVNEGDVATPVTIEFKGPAINPKVTNESTGEYVQVNRELGDTDVLNISTAFGKKHVLINGENAFHYIDLQSTFWHLEPGENLLSYNSNNDSIKTKVTVKWHSRYIGL